MSFSADVSRFVEKTKLSADLVLRKIALDGFAGLVKRSPVDTGRFRANWRVGVNEVDTTANDDTSEVASGDPVSGAETARAMTKLLTARFGDTVHLTNNLDYAEALEHGVPGLKYADGRKAHSPQAPEGVLALTFEELKANVNKLVAEVEAQT